MLKKIAVIFIFLCLFTIPASAGQYILSETDRMDGNLVKGEDYIQNDGIIVGDGIFFCKTLNGGGAVGGDLLGIYGTAKVTTVVGGNVRCIAGGLYLDGSVAKNVTAFGGTIHIKDNSNIGGGVYLAAGEVSLKGTIGKTSYIAAREVIVDGKINGDLHIYTGKEGRLYINEGAEISGVVYFHGNNAFISPAAVMSDYKEYTIFNDRKSPLLFSLHALFSFIILLLLAFIIHFFTRGVFFRCGENIRLNLKSTAKSALLLLLFLFVFFLLSAVIYLLVPLGLSIFFCLSVTFLFLGFFLFVWMFSIFPVSCFVGHLITKKDGFLTMLLGYFILFAFLKLFEIAAMYEPLAITAAIFLWAFKILIFLLGGGSLFIFLNKRMKKKQKQVVK